jgi:hypothetical protein
VEERTVGAVEGDERERERTVQRLARHRLGYPRPALHRALVGDRHQLGDRFVRLEVVLRRRHCDGSVRELAAEHLAVLEARHELRQRRAERSGVVELDLERSVKRAELAHAGACVKLAIVRSGSQ